MCTLLNNDHMKLENAGEVWGGNGEFVGELETVQMTATKKILECSKTASIVALRAEVEMHPLGINQDVRKLRGRSDVTKMPTKRLPATVNRAAWENVTERAC